MSSYNNDNELPKTTLYSGKIPLGEIVQNSQESYDMAPKRRKKIVRIDSQEDSDKSSWDGPYTQKDPLVRQDSSGDAEIIYDLQGNIPDDHREEGLWRNYADVEKVIKRSNSGIHPLENQPEVLQKSDGSEIIPPSGKLAKALNVLESPFITQEDKVPNFPIMELGGSPKIDDDV